MEDPYAIYFSSSCWGKRVFGADYDTHDGTGVRDYIHVVGHVKAIDYLNSKDSMKPLVVNLGTGKGYGKSKWQKSSI